MAIHNIPRRTKVKMELAYGLTLLDIILAFLLVAGLVLIIVTNIPYKIAIAVSYASLGFMLFIEVADGLRLYYSVILMFKFMAYPKKFSKDGEKGHREINQLIPYERIFQDRFIDFGGYYAQVIEVTPVEFFMLEEIKQDMLVRNFSNVLTRLNPDQEINIIKVRKPMVFDDYIRLDERKYATLLRQVETGEVTNEEAGAREKVFQARVNAMKALNDAREIKKDYFYLVVYDKSITALSDVCEGIVLQFRNSHIPVTAKIIQNRELAVFLKANYTSNIDIRDIDNMGEDSMIQWSMPDKVQFKATSTIINDQEMKIFNITDYPLHVPNAWGFGIFGIPGARVVMKAKPVQRYDAEKQLDKAIMEMETKTSYSARESKRIENQTHLDTLRRLLIDIKNSNEQLFNCNLFIIVEASRKKEVRSALKQQGFRFNEMFGRQVDGFVSSNLSMLDNVKEGKNFLKTWGLWYE